MMLHWQYQKYIKYVNVLQKKKKKNIIGLHHLSNNTFLLADTSLDRTVDLLCCCLTLTLLSGCQTGIVRTGGLLYVRGKNSAISADYVPTRSFRVTSLLSGGTEIQRGPLTAAHLVQGLTRSDVEGDLMLIAAMLLRTMWISSYT